MSISIVPYFTTNGFDCTIINVESLNKVNISMRDFQLILIHSNQKDFYSFKVCLNNETFHNS